MSKKTKSKSAAKRTKPKVSLVKLSNKKLNKLAKQGKLKLKKKQIRKFVDERLHPEKQPQNAAEGNDEEAEEQDIPLVEADYEYFAKPGRDFSFLYGLEKSEKGEKKRKRQKVDDDEDADIEADYAKQAKTKPEDKQMKALLPIKTKEHGVIPQMMELEPEPIADENKEQKKEKIEKPLKPVTTAELFLQRQNKLAKLKQNIAWLCSAVCENPQENYRKLKDLRFLLERDDADVTITIKKLLMVSLTEVFKDIIPDYKIRAATIKEKEQSAKKETKSLREFENSMVTHYRHFLQFLECLANGKPVKRKNRKGNKRLVDVPEEATRTLCIIAVKCMCDLLATHPHFNYRTEIISCIVPFLAHKDSNISDTVASFVKRIFREDRSGDVTLEITRLIGRMVKAKHFNVDPKVLKTFLALRIKEIYRKEDAFKEKRKVKEEKRKIMSRRDKKRVKQMGELEKELKDAAVLTDSKRRLRINTEIINVVFLAYFRILKQAQDSQLLPVVLEGLAKFAHLINVDFFDDLFSVINELVESEELTYRESLHCIQTAFTLLSGQGEALNIDPLRFYKHLYKTLFELHIGCSNEDMLLALNCLDIMISKRKKQISQQRLFAYIKRLSVLVLQLPHHSALGLLATLRAFILVDSKTDVMFDTENEGAGLYLPELDDPEHCNAHNTALYELHTLRKHYHPAVRRYGEHLLKGAPSQGAGALPTDIARKSTADLMSDFDSSDMNFKPPMRNKPKTTKKVFLFGNYLQDSMQCDVNKVLLQHSDVIVTPSSNVAMETDSRAFDSKMTASDSHLSKNTKKNKRRGKNIKSKEINIGALENL